MPRKYNIDRVILEILQDGDLSRAEIVDRIRSRIEFSVTDKTINEAIFKLLKASRITVTGYDLGIYNGVDRVQSLKPDGIMFGLVQRDPLEMNLLIRKLESENLHESESALNKLRKIFRAKTAKIGVDAEDIFGMIINEILSLDPDQKRIMTQKLAYALSDEDDAHEQLRHLITYFEIRAGNM
ncbi:hypothetical protein [Methanothermobacter sp.]|uniref:hypothetical protein n=1 Tax=Methanothermobacter sp. TaxID=1884223 RepID=UPI00260FF9DD|nr:hypothetical protein [Methanothermobacter sp.]MDI9615559.1 hypothetical protein [Methanothermobacter sp.]